MGAKEISANEYISLYKYWAKTKNLDHTELNEYMAFEKFIDSKVEGNRFVSIYEGKRLISFGTYEICNDSYAITHFAKGNTEYKGVYEALFHAIAKILEKKNVEYWNFEQDLGIPALRRSKQKYSPIGYLEKFTVQKNRMGQ